MKKGFTLLAMLCAALLLTGCVVTEASGEEEGTENERHSEKTSVESEYVQFLDTNFTHVTETLERINALSQEQRPRDESWIMQMAVEIVKLERHIKEAEGYRPVPMRFTAFHKKYVETLDVFRESAWTLIAVDQRKRPQNAVVGEIGREIRDRERGED